MKLGMDIVKEVSVHQMEEIACGLLSGRLLSGRLSEDYGLV